MQENVSTPAATTPNPSRRRDSNDDYTGMLAALGARAVLPGPYFETSVEGPALWRAWLDALPVDERQHHNCHSCRRFVENYGGLVTIDRDGTKHSVFFAGQFPGMFDAAAVALKGLIQRARVTGVHVSSDKMWGIPKTRDGKREGVSWHHMHASPASALLYTGKVKTASQRAAELLEDYSTLCRALSEFSEATFGTALSIAESEGLYRGEKVKGRLQWLLDLKLTRAIQGPARDNLTWRAVATAPAGFCHVKSSVVGTLLEDIEAGKSFEQVKRAFDAKMNPLQYQRPTAPPSAGNIKQAEAIVEKLGIAPSLRRRFARFEDVAAVPNAVVWTPRPESKLGATKEGVFGYLLETPKKASPIVAKAPAMTWSKFASTILPTVDKLEAFVPYSGGNFHAILTAADPDAPGILQWDVGPGQGDRNPLSWYTYSGGSPASQWNLKSGYVAVDMVARMPNACQPGFAHHGDGVVLILEGCRDTRKSSSGLFPELLKSDLHAVRSTIEAHSNRNSPEGAEEASACGLAIRSGGTMKTTIRATSRGQMTEYVIDRWD